VSARSLVFILLAACGAAALTAVAATGRLVPGEVSLARTLQDAPLGHAIEELADGLASKFVEYTLIGLLAVVAILVRRYELAVAALLVIAGMALNPAIKELVQRSRPTEADVVVREHAAGFGFPSGHVQHATLAYGYAAAAAARLLTHTAAAAVIGAATIAVAAVGFNRVYNGAHWPSDVAGGALIGLVLVVVAVRLPEELRRRFAARAERGTRTAGGL